MASEYKPYIAINLSKLNSFQVVQRLQPGDPYSFFQKELIKAEDPIDETKDFFLAIGDRFSKWFATNEPGRVFEITGVYKTPEHWVYQTKFLGFAVIREARGYLHSTLSTTPDGLNPITI